jgi:uncharacterized SAM-binding protein YcdF (DUF218 family)
VPSWLLTKEVLKSLLLPPVGLILLALASAALLPRRIGVRMAVGAIAALLVLATPVVPHALLGILAPPPFAPADARGAGAIVVLGAGTRRDAPEYGADTLSSLTLERVRYAARIAKATLLPVLVSGGAPQGGAAEAVLMRNVLEQELGVAVHWVEPNSNNTRENAMESAAILKREAILKVIVVTHAFDALRATQEFRAEGVDVIAAATNLPRRIDLRVTEWIPSSAALQLSYYVCYEIAALATRRVPRAIAEWQRRQPS